MAISKEKGFTLVELAVVMAILALLAALTTPRIIDEVNEKRAGVTVQETQAIIDAARTYRMKYSTWPGHPTCLNALSVLSSMSPPMLVGISSTNKYSSPVTTSCTEYTFSVDQNAAEGWDGYIANSLPATTIENDSTYLIRTTIGVPGSEPALDSKLSRVATGNADLNRMATTLFLGNHNIEEVNNILAVSGRFSGEVEAASAVINGLLNAQGDSQFGGTATFNGQVVFSRVVNEGVSCAPSGAVGRNSVGTVLMCRSGLWVKSATWNSSVVSTGGTCPENGAFGFDSSGRLHVCRK